MAFLKRESCFNVILLLIIFTHVNNLNKDDTAEEINISDYKYPDPNDSDVYRIVLFGTNDLHGTIFPRRLFNPITSQFYEKGGAEYIGSYITILRNEWKNRFLWLDGGDQFQGGLEFSISEGNIMNEFYNTKKLDGIMLGNHDFDLGYEKLISKMKASNFDYLVANLYDSNTQSYEFMPNQKRSKLYTVDKVKIGVIGIATLDTKPFSPSFPDNIDIKDQKESILSEAKLLRKQGANAIILLSHIGLLCNDKDLLKLQLRAKDTLQSKCDELDGEFYKLISSLEPGIIDGIIAGHRHAINHHWINNIPTIQSNGFGYSNIMYLSFNPTTLELLPDKTSIEGPLPSCGKVFEKTKLCEYIPKEELVNAGSLMKFKFHNIIIEKDPELEKPLEEWRKQIEIKQSNYITHTEDEMKANGFKETTLMNIFSDFSMILTGAHLSFFNIETFRTTWYPGPINEIDMFNMSPFENHFTTFEMAGHEVLRLLKIVQGPNNVYSMGGVNRLYRFDPNNKIQLLEAKLYNGIRESYIDPKETYTLCTSDYLSNGGSEMGEVLKWYKMRNRKDYPISTRDHLSDYLKKIPNLKANMFIDDNNQRVRFIN